MLIRSGIQRIRLIDFDQITLSSLNRHSLATQNDIGTSKAECLKYHLLKIAPHVQIEAKVCLFSIELAKELLGDSPDYVLGIYILSFYIFY